MQYCIKWTNTLSGTGSYREELYSKEEAEEIADMLRERGHNHIFEVVSEEDATREIQKRKKGKV